MRILVFLLLLISTNIYSQEVNGILYDSEGPISEFEIWNITQQITSTTDEGGRFKIQAEIGDTLFFNSITYEKKSYIINQQDLEEAMVIELKNTINQLDEINLSSEIDSFDDRKFNTEFKSEIQKDRAENLFQYKVPNPKGNIYVLLESWYHQLFPDDPIVETIQFNDLQVLFNEDENINLEFLSKELQIPETYHAFFFDYLESKSLNKNLLQEKNRLSLIQKLYNLSEEYRSINNLSN